MLQEKGRKFGQCLGVQEGFSYTPEVGSEEDTEAPLTEDNIVQFVQGTNGEEADTKQDCGLSQEDSVSRVSLREGLSHAKVFQAALEQHKAFNEEEYSPVRKIVNKMHAHLVSTATQKKISDFLNHVILHGCSHAMLFLVNTYMYFR